VFANLSQRPVVPVRYLNWYSGWTLLLLAFASGILIGLFFHSESFLGGYTSFPRRMLRLGHIALAALGMLNLIFSIAPVSLDGRCERLASTLLLIGAITMPIVCFATARWASARFLFPVPVTALILSVIFILLGTKT